MAKVTLSLSVLPSAFVYRSLKMLHFAQDKALGADLITSLQVIQHYPQLSGHQTFKGTEKGCRLQQLDLIKTSLLVLAIPCENVK